MRLGVVLPFGDPEGGGLRPGTIPDAARRIERHGFDGIWTFDAHHRGFLLPDPLTALAIAATVTERVELGTSVLQVPLRPAYEIAERAAFVQLLSGNRLTLGIGAGSTESDFVAMGVPMADRFRLLARRAVAIRDLLRGDPADGATLAVWPGVTAPPVLIGAVVAGRWLERGARDFDGWIGSARSAGVEAVLAGLGRFRELGGRRAIAGSFDAGRPDAAEVLAAFAAAGFDDAIVTIAQHTDAELARVRALVG